LIQIGAGLALQNHVDRGAARRGHARDVNRVLRDADDRTSHDEGRGHRVGGSAVGRRIEVEQERDSGNLDFADVRLTAGNECDLLQVAHEARRRIG
jgi:hypothetical protein